MSQSTTLPLPRGLLLDMDGTITEPMLDFPQIKREMGIGTQPILEAMTRMSPTNRATAEAILARHEQHAAENSRLSEGCVAFLQWIRDAGLKSALVTRNTRASVTTVLEKHRLSFDALITRDDAPYKPDPAPLHLACQRLHLQPDEVWMIGDGQYDIEAGDRAGIKTIWISHGQSRPSTTSPWREVRNLVELVRSLKS